MLMLVMGSADPMAFVVPQIIQVHGRAFCSCPDEFSHLIQLDNWAACHKGWKKNKELVDFVKLKNVDFPFTSYKLVEGPQVNEASCRQLCLDDCLYVVAIYEEKSNLCWKKTYPLSNGRQSPNITRITLIKVPKDHGSDKKDQSLVDILALLLGSYVFLNSLFFLISSMAVYYLYYKKMKLAWNIDRTLATNVRNYTYKELKEATRGIKQILGRGAFGIVEEISTSNPLNGRKEIIFFKPFYFILFQ
ncbi:g-type lectin s-receptor-like serine/threonine-protein kinase rlk1 [Quercus suber]|uniref:G-type lectin s-receptor-like serine/threonine-protein kinase rlk1 n=1 Tax=Quercus suber TaxID=58331 RepID=A0AAW0IQT9_QUESU